MPLELLLPLIPISLTSGINLYLTVLSIAIADRAELIALPEGLSYITSWPVMIVAGVLLVIEFFADKIPFVDSVWDFLHTVVRPAGAAAIAFGLVPRDQPEVMAAAVLIAGTTALTSHATKASFRALVNTSPEPVSNSLVSVTEDAAVIGLLVLLVQFPLIAAGVSIVLVVLLIVALIFIFRWARKAFGSVGAFLRHGRRKPKEPDAYPVMN